MSDEFFIGLRDATLEGLDYIRKEERWLYKNKKAFESVMMGLEQARQGEFAEPPELIADTGVMSFSSVDELFEELES